MKRPPKNKPLLRDFNNRAHEPLRKLLDRAEDQMIAQGVCLPHEVEDYQCREYIEQLCVTTFGTCNYVQTETEVGAMIFLSGLCNTYGLPKLPNALERECARQLTYHQSYYFRDFHSTMTKVLIEHLQEASDEEFRNHRFKALFQIAAVTIPNAREQIRREYRRRGLDVPMLVGDRVLGQHMAVSRRPRLGGPH